MSRIRMSEDFFEELAEKCGCDYVSDLPALASTRFGRKQLSLLIEETPAKRFSLFVWNDLLSYLTALPAEPTAEKARERLIIALSGQVGIPGVQSKAQKNF